MTLTRIKDRPVNTLVIISTSQPSVWVDHSGTQQRWRFPYLFRLPFLWWLYSHLWQVKSSFADQSTFLYWKLSSSLFVCLFFFFTDAIHGPEESLTLRNFNADFQPSVNRMLAMLKNASLESHGFTKQVITSDRRDSKTNNETFEKTFFYYQVVPCSRASEVVQKLQTLMPGKYLFL